MDDRQLVADFLKKRNESAFRQLYHRKTPQLYQLALRLTQDPELSQELIQRMWVVAIRKLKGFEWRSELKTWLTAILVNLYRDHQKSEKKRMAWEENNQTSSPDWTIAGMDLEAAIAQLPSGYRQIIILHDVEGYKHREVAELLNITEGTSKSQLFHARRALRQYLNDEPSKKLKT